jgi:hypothetical protein
MKAVRKWTREGAHARKQGKVVPGNHEIQRKEERCRSNEENGWILDQS